MAALGNIRVLEWGELISAAYCCKLLGEFGATVDKLEPPGGDALRACGPFPGDVPDPESAGLFVYLNSGKRSVVADVSEEAGRATLEALLARADVFVTNQPLALRRRLALDAPALRVRHPHLVCVSLSVYGDSGPNAEVPAEAIDAYAASGTAWVIGEPGGSPLILPLQQADYQAGAHAAAATLMALIGRRRNAPGRMGGPGEAIDISSADVFASAAGSNGMIYLYYGLQKWARAGRRAFASGGPYPYVILPCKDGAVCLIGRARHEWTRLVQAMGAPAWASDPRYQDLHAMGRDYPDEVDALVTPWLMQHTRAELLQLSEQHGFPVGPLRQMSEVVASPQFAHRGFFRDIPHARHGSIRVPGVPWQFTDEPAAAPAAAPLLGEHTDAVLAELAAAPEAAPAAVAT
jgi:crotonobetainyl-CoA:carnitine CoA-transferase CaiB-like acyl-CoA transferase